VQQDAPKIFRIGKSTAILACGDERFKSIITNLNKRKNISKQVTEQLKHRKLNAYWACHVARFNKRTEKMELTSFLYQSGEIKIEEHDRDMIQMDTFSPEMKDAFQKNVMIFYLADTNEKIKIVRFFFDEISQLYDGQAGGAPIVAKLDRNGFQWLLKPHAAHTQNFTGYSFKFMPERIETTATTEQAWSSDQLTDILTLTFECESTMLLLIHAYCYGRIVNPTGSSGECFRYHELAIDGNIKNTTFGGIGGYCLASGGKHAAIYECHHIEIVTKGSHALTLKMASCCENHTAYANARRLTIIKSFYQGGAS
jgi:hypothetical protein